MKLGTLEIHSVFKETQLLAKPVQEYISTLNQEKENIGVAEIDPTLSDTHAFCEHYGATLAHAANCVILEAKRGEMSQYVACVVLANTKADINGLARKTLDVRKLSFAPMDKAVEETGMEYGAITPIGLPHNWTILIDTRVIDSDLVVIGSGVRKSKIIISGISLQTLPNVIVLENLGVQK
jgi:prolyl-tRNA editing enzyme YbaK/EbsC (Cys-tRNA(Pro) deacylase)